MLYIRAICMCEYDVPKATVDVGSKVLKVLKVAGAYLKILSSTQNYTFYSNDPLSS